MSVLQITISIKLNNVLKIVIKQNKTKTVYFLQFLLQLTAKSLDTLHHAMSKINFNQNLYNKYISSARRLLR